MPRLPVLQAGVMLGNFYYFSQNLKLFNCGAVLQSYMSCTGKTERNVQSYGKRNFFGGVELFPVWCSSRCRVAVALNRHSTLTKHIDRKLEWRDLNSLGKNTNTCLQ